MTSREFLSGLGDPIRFPFPEALTEPEKLLSAYFQSTTVGLCILDSAFRFVAVSDKLAEMNGIPAQDHVGKTVRQVLGDFADIVEPEFQRVLSTGETS